MTSNKIDLRTVTLCAVDCINPRLAAAALDISNRHCQFAETILLTNQDIDCNARVIPIGPIGSKQEYSNFILKELHRHIATPWVLLVQWDGYVLDPAMWTDDFLAYDYIGARWPFRHDDMAVGNGGFSLRSKRLLDALASDRRFATDEATGEDELIGRTFRPALEADYGIRFAPDDLADRFSVELADLRGPTFGFHGVFNMHRSSDDAEIVFIAEHAHVSTASTGEFIGLWFRCLDAGRTHPAKQLYARIRDTLDPAWIEQTLVTNGLAREDAAVFVAHGEAHLSTT